MGFKVRFTQPVLDPDTPEYLSLIPAGRAVRLEPVYEDERALSVQLAALWSAAVPLQFTPHDRNPLPGPTQDRFYYLGPWQVLYDNLMAEGRGHLAWTSVCVAAQVDAGRWRGDRELERFVQAQIHRLGLNCGPLDGRVGERTKGVLQSMGLSPAELKTLARDLASRNRTLPSRDERTIGHLVLPQNFSVTSTGDVKVQRTVNGATLTVDGPGKVIVEVT